MDFDERIQWCLIVVRFIKSKTSGGNLEMAVDYVAQKKDKRGLDSMHRDLSEWITGFSITSQNELNQILIEKLGRTLKQTLFGFDKAVDRILKKGYIKSNRDYEIVMSKVDEVTSSNSDDTDELNKLNALLIKYHERKKEKKNS